DLKVKFPDRFNDADFQKKNIRHLAPPPVASADLIVAASGGMFYSRETPASDPYVMPGDHFNVGEPLYIIEVMKMFNKVVAEFSGTIEERLVPDDGVVVKKGQPLFRVKPDEERKIETPEEAEKRRKAYTDSLLAEL
ncbi:MAG: biotin carboxylase, partial [Leptospiraceae bacterium]|nr:biotin carboxylase [Leptospiraceae bacterium]